MSRKPALRGEARRQRIAVNAELADARNADRIHVKACWQCTKAGVDVYRRCDHGWTLAKRLHRAEYAKFKFDNPDELYQPSLFDPEE